MIIEELLDDEMPLKPTKEEIEEVYRKVLKGMDLTDREIDILRCYL